MVGKGTSHLFYMGKNQNLIIFLRQKTYLIRKMTNDAKITMVLINYLY